MEFLVKMELRFPDDMDDARVDALKAAERERGLELVANGTIRRIWRIPGRTANVGWWDAADADDLDAAISSLPLFKYLDVDVTALATHYLERASG